MSFSFRPKAPVKHTSIPASMSPMICPTSSSVFFPRNHPAYQHNADRIKQVLFQLQIFPQIRITFAILVSLSNQISNFNFTIVILLLKSNCFHNFFNGKIPSFRRGNKLILHIIASMDNTDNSRSIFLHRSINTQ